MYITETDYEKITGLVGVASLPGKDAAMADLLLKELRSARTIPQDRISNNVVTMNSRVLLREIGSGRQTDITITWPQDADSRARKVSLLSPIGIALLGSREGNITSWRVPGGVGRFRIEKVLYQPEAEGHFSL